jgi:hypothetical protein
MAFRPPLTESSAFSGERNEVRVLSALSSTHGKSNLSAMLTNYKIFHEIGEIRTEFVLILTTVTSSESEEA